MLDKHPVSTYNYSIVPYPTPSHPQITTNQAQCGTQYAYAANSLLQTVDIDVADLKNWAILDSGATSHFLVTSAPVTDITPAISPLTVQIPNGERVTSTHTCNLDMPQLPQQARRGHIMPGLASHSLLSVTKLCNAGCKVNFSMIGCTISYRGQTVVCGKKCTTTGLWMIPLTNTTPSLRPSLINDIPTSLNTEQLHSIQELASNVVQTNSMPELAMYYHQCLLSPPKSTLLKALANQPLTTFPGLDHNLISKHLPESTATDKGHMKRRRKNVRSTRNNQQAIVDARYEVADMNPTQQMCSALDMFCFAALADANEGTMYTDLTGKFPVRSYKNNQYIFVAYFYSLNAIIVRPMENRTDECMVATFKDIIDYLKSCGHQPHLNVMDNECSKAVQEYITSEEIAIQLVEPKDHRVNAAERAIQTFKHHFVAGLATVDIDFPIQLWDEFLLQAQMTLNFMRTSRLDPNKTSYEELEGAFDFNKTPLAPLGTKALLLEDPDARASWAPHGTDAFYVGPAMRHYRCKRFFVPETRGFRVSGSYKIYPTHCKQPSVSQADLTLQTANELHQSLQLTDTQQLKLSTLQKLRHVDAITSLIKIITDSTPPRVVPTDNTHLVPSAPSRVNAPSTSVNPTSPTILQKTKLVHRRQTRSNTPMPIVMEEIEPPIISPTVQQESTTTVSHLPTLIPFHPTIPHTNSNPTPTSENLPTVEPSQLLPNNKTFSTTKHPTIVPRRSPRLNPRLSNGTAINSKRNSAKRISRKRLQNLIEEQTARDTQLLKLHATQEQLTSKVPIILPTASPFISYHHPSPKGGPAAIPTITQDDEDSDHEPQQPYKRTPLPHFQRPPSPAAISREALYHIVGVGYTNAPLITIPRTLEKSKLSIIPAIDIEEMCNGVVHPVTQETITKYQKLANDPLLQAVWKKAMAKELGRLAQGFGDTEGTDTIRFLTHDEIRCIPADRTITYARIVVDYRPQKDDPNRVRITAGGNLIDYPYELTTRTADLTTTKIMWNSVISTEGAKYACADAKNFYLTAPLERHEYMRMPIDIFPQEFIDQYGLAAKVKNGFVYCSIIRCMYGLPQSGILANKLLRERLLKHGYYEMPHTPGFWKHVSRPVSFTLTVDDFGIKYVGEEHAKHLIGVLEENYTMDVDWTGGLYCGISLSWNYEQRYVDISMPNYVKKKLIEYEHEATKRAQYCPYSPNPIKYGKSNQDPMPEDTSKPLENDDKKFIQRVVGSFLFYARAIDMTILHALSAIAGAQAAPTMNTLKRVKQLLDYMATNPNAIIRYRASDMILNVHSDASYLSAPRARSRAGGYFFLGSIPQDGRPIKLNGAIHVTCTILKLVASSAAEAELGALFLNAQEATIMRLILREMGHPQPPTPVHIDNTTAVGIVNGTIKRQRSRAMEMRYFWLLDRQAQLNFAFHYTPGHENLGDYPSKAHTADIHQHVRPYYIHLKNSPIELIRAAKPSARRGCVETLQDAYRKNTPLPRVSDTIRAQANSTHIIVQPLNSFTRGIPYPTNSDRPATVSTQTSIPQRCSSHSRRLLEYAHAFQQLASTNMIVS